MSIKKRLAALALALAMLAGLSACDQADNNVGTDEGIVTTQTETEETISP